MCLLYERDERLPDGDLFAAAEIALDHIESGVAVDLDDKTLADIEAQHAAEDALLRADVRSLANLTERMAA